MTHKQQQRLIGTLLLVFFISVLAYFILSKVNQTESGRQVAEEESFPFSSVIEPLQEETDSGTEIDTGPTLAEEAFVDIDPDATDKTSRPSTNPEIVGIQPQIIEKIEDTVINPVSDVVSPGTTLVAPDTKPKPAPKKVKPAASPPTTQSNTTAEAASSQWILQLGSFSKEANATSLKKKLEDIGYKPMIEQFHAAGSLIYRVRLQPNSDRAVLEKAAKSIHNQLNLYPQIFAYP